MAKHLVLISVDALSIDNWEQINELPTFSALIRQGAYSRTLRSVFPTLTYAVHASLVTGMYPDRHGILHNHPFQPFVPEQEKLWYWYRKSLRAQPIYDVARIHGLTTAALMWPVSGGADIHYNLPEIVALQGESQALKVLRAGSALFCLELEMRFRHLRKGVGQPFLDDFTTASAAHTLKKYRPNLMLMHLIDLDSQKHYHGTQSQATAQALERMDRRLAEMTVATKAAGTYDDTAFLVIGDHGQLDVHYRVRPNNLLRECGLIDLEGGRREWRAYLQCSGGSAYLYVRSGDDAAREQALGILRQTCAAGKHGLERVYEQTELRGLRVGNDIAAALEAQAGYYFDEAVDEPTVQLVSSPGVQYATHGYSPDKPNYSCVFIAAGKGVAIRGDLGTIEMVDIAPTMAKLLGVPFPCCDGLPIAGIG